MRLGTVALLSLSTLRALSAVEQRQADHLTRAIVAQGRTDDSLIEADTQTPIAERIEAATLAARSAVLTPGERMQLNSARPGSRSIVWRKPAVAEDDDQPLPPGYVAPAVAPYVSAFLPMDAEIAAIEAAARTEAAVEFAQWERDAARDAAAVDFVSDWQPRFASVDFAPLAKVYRAETPRPEVKAALRDAVSEHADLLARIRGNAPLRRSTVRV